MQKNSTYNMITEFNNFKPEYIEHRVLDIDGKYAILSINKKNGDLYSGLYTYGYDDRGLVDISKKGDNFFFYDGNEYDYINNIQEYDDFVSSGINDDTLYISGNIEDAIEQMKLLWDRKNFNI